MREIKDFTHPDLYVRRSGHSSSRFAIPQSGIMGVSVNLIARQVG